jgi:pimeloyl-ACP methyl ester carboxylesterase
MTSRMSVMLGVLGLLMPLASTAAQTPPRFEPGPCPFEAGDWMEGERIECGTVQVSESRDRPDGRTLRLAVAILRSRSPDPLPDPVVFLSGGPGAASVRFAPAFARSRLWGAIRGHRDLVIWDQRGTGYSEPEFCPDSSAALMATNLDRLSTDERVGRMRRLLAECRTRVLAEGLDLSAYNSVASARDLDNLRRALGYDTWNVFGGSYGTRLALIAARDVPGGIRSLILDSTSPTDLAGEDSMLDDFARSLALVSARCDADPACASVFPDIEGELHAAIEELNAEPLVVPMADTSRFPAGQIVVDGRLLALGIFQGLYVESLIPLVPHTIRQIRARNQALIGALAEELAPDPEITDPWMQYAVECYEQAPLMREEAAAAARARHPLLQDITAPRLSSICDAWHGHRADTALLHRGVTSDIPTFVAAGEFDPITPPSHGMHVTATLPRSQFIEVRGAAHGALGSACARQLMIRFLDAPEQVLDTSCLADVPDVVMLADLRIAPGLAGALLRLSEGPGPGLIVWAGATFLLLLSAPVTWLAAPVIRRVRRRPAGPRDGRSLARVLAAVTALTAVSFVAGLALVIRRVAENNPFILGFGIPGDAGYLLLLPWVVAVLAAGTAVCAVLSWRGRWWGAWARVHYAAVATAGLSFVGLMLELGIF